MGLVHFWKERFPNHRKSKLDHHDDGPFHILEKINHNAYKIDLPDKYQVNSTFNVSDLSPFYAVVDLRANHVQEGWNDTIIDATFNEENLAKVENGLKKLKKYKDNFQIPIGLITRA